ncbi:MAG: SMP-30/gluconolactonase/LRE family protein [Bacteroidota bacterium]
MQKIIDFIFVLFFVSCFGGASYAQQVTTIVEKPGARFEGITWAPDGRIFVVDFFTGEVFRTNTDGNLRRIGQFSGSLGGAVDAEGNFYFSEFSTGNIIKVARDDTHSVYTSGLFGPAGILIDTVQQLMYVTNYNANNIARIDMKASEPKPAVWAQSARISGPDGLAFSPNGDIISANFLNNRIQRISADGSVSAFTRVEDSRKTGYIVRWKDSYLVTGADGTPDVYLISPDGDVSRFAGTGQKGVKDGDISEASFDFPNGIALSPDGNSLLITESSAVGRIRLISGLDQTTSVEELPLGAQIQVRPNPAVSFVDLSMDLPEAGQLEVKLLTMKGDQIDTLLQAHRPVGQLQEHFEFHRELPSGLYILQVRLNKHVFTKQIFIE